MKSHAQLSLGLYFHEVVAFWKCFDDVGLRFDEAVAFWKRFDDVGPHFHEVGAFLGWHRKRTHPPQ